jgi:hypothetical protein
MREMGSLKDYYPSPWLRSEDLDGPTVVTIKHVRDEKFPGQRGEPDQVKPVLFFRELGKGMIVNKTNYMAISKITGKSNTDDWVGATIQLRVEQVPAFGEVVDAIRIRPVPRTGRFEGEDDLPDWVTDPV